MEYSYVQQGFRSCLDDAIRAGPENTGIGNNGDVVNGDVTTSNHQQLRNKEKDEASSNTTVLVVVDYATFKRKLKKYSQRRQKLRRLIDSSSSSLDDNETIYIEDFENILKEFDTNNRNNTGTEIISREKKLQNIIAAAMT